MTLLGTLGNNAPFVGLLGTVLGVIEAFHQLGAAGQNKEAMGNVMAGIAEALVATGVGLFVALPAVVAYNIVQKKIGEIEANVAVARQAGHGVPQGTRAAARALARARGCRSPGAQQRASAHVWLVCPCPRGARAHHQRGRVRPWEPLSARGRGKRGGIVGINVTPMVDVVLVLLVIMMVSATYIVSQSLKVELPKTATSDEAAQSIAAVTITKDGLCDSTIKRSTSPTWSRSSKKLAHHRKT